MTVETDGSTVNNWGNIRVFNSSTGNQIFMIEKVALNGLRASAFSPSGEYFAVTPASSSDVYLRVYHASNYTLHRKYTDPKGPYGDMRCVVFSADSDRIIAGGADRTLRQYSISQNAMLTRTSTTSGDWIDGCDYSADGQRIAFSEDYSVRVIDSSTGKQTLQRIQIGSSPYAVTYRPT
jgi:WD40 repeat protein